jgi:hypothetical protein
LISIPAGVKVIELPPTDKVILVELVMVKSAPAVVVVL